MDQISLCSTSWKQQIILKDLCYRIRGEHHSSIVKVDGLYHKLLSVHITGAVTWLTKEACCVKRHFKCRTCAHVKAATRWLASFIPSKLDVYKGWLQTSNSDITL